jgi:hypothetical protein
LSSLRLWNSFFEFLSNGFQNLRHDKHGHREPNRGGEAKCVRPLKAEQEPDHQKPYDKVQCIENQHRPRPAGPRRVDAAKIVHGEVPRSALLDVLVLSGPGNEASFHGLFRISLFDYDCFDTAVEHEALVLGPVLVARGDPFELVDAVVRSPVSAFNPDLCLWLARVVGRSGREQGLVGQLLGLGIGGPVI